MTSTSYLAPLFGTRHRSRVLGASLARSLPTSPGPSGSAGASWTSRGGIYAAGHIPAVAILPEPLSIGKGQYDNGQLSRAQLCVGLDGVEPQL